MEHSNPREQLVAKIADLKEVAAIALVNERIENGDDPLAITEDCQEGLRIVGQRYERQEYFLAGQLYCICMGFPEEDIIH